jgi:hypothetical protein
MISEKKAMEMLGGDLVTAYHEMHRVQGSWERYVSLPFIYRKFGVKASSLFDRKVVVFVHPGHAIYTKGVMVMVKENEKKYGNYEKEYFEQLMRRIAEAHENKEKIIVYVSNDKLNDVLQIVGEEDVILVPTLPGENTVDVKILGVSKDNFYEFMRIMGIKEAESDGEFKDRCYTFVNDDIKNAGIKVSQKIHYPVRGSYEDDVLFYMTEEEDAFYLKFCKEFDEWCEKTYKEHASRLGIKNGSCEATILKETIKCTDNDYMHPWGIQDLCKKWGKEEIEKALKKLEEHGLLRISSATELLNKESLKLYYAFNRILEEKHEEYKPDEIIVPLIECELFKD